MSESWLGTFFLFLVSIDQLALRAFSLTGGDGDGDTTLIADTCHPVLA